MHTWLGVSIPFHFYKWRSWFYENSCNEKLMVVRQRSSYLSYYVGPFWLQELGIKSSYALRIQFVLLLITGEYNILVVSFFYIFTQFLYSTPGRKADYSRPSFIGGFPWHNDWFKKQESVLSHLHLSHCLFFHLCAIKFQVFRKKCSKKCSLFQLDFSVYWVMVLDSKLVCFSACCMVSTLSRVSALHFWTSALDCGLLTILQ